MSFGLVWIVPFAGLLLSIAVVPLLAPRFWRRLANIVPLIWALAFVVPFFALYGSATVGTALLHALLLDYLPFIILLTVLFAVAGGIRLTGTIRGTPGVNTLMLLIGAGAASVMGTTGASMLIVRPLIRANRQRRRNAHVFVFLVILVGNIGGALTPLGDPPLLIGFLQGVPFFWPTVHLFWPTLLMVACLLAVFYPLDRLAHRRGWHDETDPIAEIERLGIDGKVNIPLLALIPVVVFLAGALRDRLPIVPFVGLHLETAMLAGDLVLLMIGGLSLRLTRSDTRRANDFSWAPMVEVAAIFAGIFITVIPALAMLREGAHGPLAVLVNLAAPGGAPVDGIFFWLTGALSSVLDNAPTYLVFFNLAGGDPTALTGPSARTLAAISLGAVAMGANTYIGNAPNFMIKAICDSRGVQMPGFFGYIAWAVVLLFPLYGVVTLLFFR